MEIFGFWILVALVVVFFLVTKQSQRRELIRSGWLILLLAGAAGFLWELFH